MASWANTASIRRKIRSLLAARDRRAGSIVDLGDNDIPGTGTAEQRPIQQSRPQPSRNAYAEPIVTNTVSPAVARPSTLRP